MSRSMRGPVLVATLTALCCSSVAEGHAQECAPQRDNIPRGSIPLPAPGTYRLTLVAIAGPEGGQRASGTLTLMTATAADSSPRTGALPDTASLATYPMYGWTDVDFDKVAIPVGSSDEHNGGPTSEDPVYPGVLVHVFPVRGQNKVKGIELLIGTRSNHRTSDIIVNPDGTKGVRLSMDGPGIAPRILWTSASGFGGTWAYWRFGASAQGYFCAEVVSVR